jgi:hypothetical protein
LIDDAELARLDELAGSIAQAYELAPNYSTKASRDACASIVV